LKILKRFKAQQEFVLETGDMLYLPPHVAHHGVAIGECMTWSIGFRAPSFHELFVYYADFLRDELPVAGRYADPDLNATVHTGAAGTHFERALRKSLGRSLQQARDVQLMNRALGRFLTEPKAHVTFEAPDRARSPARFFRAAMRTGVELALATRLLSVAGRFFINGRELETAAADQSAWQQLADTRRLSRETLQRVSAAAAEALAQLYQQGELILNEANG
jgi:50S ribosomal protein L16 3-hydroxylase